MRKMSGWSLVSVAALFVVVSSVSAEPTEKKGEKVKLRVCALYETGALTRAKAEVALDAECRCKVTEKVCEVNWRKAEKHWWRCLCRKTPPCDTVVCAVSDITAVPDAIVECEKPSCSCIKTDKRCGKGYLGKKYKFRCHCP